VLLRLPGAVKQVFEERLRQNLPLRAEKVLRRMREAHGGKLYDSSYGTRQTGHGQYAQSDIAYGAQLYAAQCATCHGSNGDQVGGVNLRTGQIRRASTDNELMRLLTTGIPGAGMPSFKFVQGEQLAIVAYLRNMNSIDAGSVKIGNASAQNSLGRLYEDGVGVVRSEKDAVSWYRKAAAQGHPDARSALARLLPREAASAAGR